MEAVDGAAAKAYAASFQTPAKPKTPVSTSSFVSPSVDFAPTNRRSRSGSLPVATVVSASPATSSSLLPPFSFSSPSIFPPSLSLSFIPLFESYSPSTLFSSTPDPFLSCSGVVGETEVFQAASVTQAESALPTASGIMEAFGQSEGLSLPATTTEAGEQAAPLAQTEAEDQVPNTEAEGSEASTCSKCSKRSRQQSPPPIPLSPPTQEELVEWVFSHPNTHPLAAKGMLPVFSNSLTQQVDHIRRVMVHFSRLLLLAHNQAQREGAEGGPNMQTRLYQFAMQGITPPGHK